MRRTIGAIAIVAVLANLACSSIREIPPAEIDGPKERVLAATYSNGKVIEFQKVTVADTTEGAASPRMRKSMKNETFIYGVYSPQAGTIEGLGMDGRNVRVPIDSLSTVSVRRTDGVKTTLAVLGISAGAFAAVLLIAVALDPYSSGF